MSDEWRAGDLALCIKQGDWISAPSDPNNDGPIAGQILTVKVVVAGHGVIALGFAEWEPALFRSTRFRKIPPHIPDEEDREAIRLMTGVPVKEPV